MKLFENLSGEAKSEKLSKEMEEVVYPDDCDLALLSRHAGIDQDFDLEAVETLYSNISEASWRKLGNVELYFSPNAKKASKAYYVHRDDQGHETLVTWAHPSVDACKSFFQLVQRKKLEEEQAKAGINHAPKKVTEQQQVAKRNALTSKAFMEAELHYKGVFGNPEMDDVRPVDLGKSYWTVTPKEIKKCAWERFGFDVVKEPELAWVVRQFLAVELPPRWAVADIPLDTNETTNDNEDEEEEAFPARYECKGKGCTTVDQDCFVYRPNDNDPDDFVYLTKHPAHSYFENLVLGIREEKEMLLETGGGEDALLEFFNEPHHLGRLTFWDGHYYYTFDFQADTGEKLETHDPPPFREDTDEQQGRNCLDNQSSAWEAEHFDEDLYDKEDLQNAFTMATPKDIWQLLMHHTKEEDLVAFAKHVGVRLQEHETEFLAEIAEALLCKLPEGWVRRRDPDGLVHYSCKEGTQVKELWHCLEKPDQSKVKIPQWMLKATQRGFTVSVLKVYSYSLLHPLADQVKLKIAKIRKKREKDKLRDRLKQRQEESEKLHFQSKEVFGNKKSAELLRAADMDDGDDLHHLASEGEAQRSAYFYYVDCYGDPRELGEIDIRPCANHKITPKHVHALARHLLIGMDETHMYWIAYLRADCGLPPNWVEEENVEKGTKSFTHTDGTVLDHHPGDIYFLKLATQVREQEYTDPGLLELKFIDEKGSPYLFNFTTMEKKMFSKASHQGTSRRRSSSTFLNSSRYSIKTDEPLVPASPNGETSAVNPQHFYTPQNMKSSSMLITSPLNAQKRSFSFTEVTDQHEDGADDHVHEKQEQQQENQDDDDDEQELQQQDDEVVEESSELQQDEDEEFGTRNEDKGGVVEITNDDPVASPHAEEEEEEEEAKDVKQQVTQPPEMSDCRLDLNHIIQENLKANFTMDQEMKHIWATETSLQSSSQRSLKMKAEKEPPKRYFIMERKQHRLAAKEEDDSNERRFLLNDLGGSQVNLRVSQGKYEIEGWDNRKEQIYVEYQEELKAELKRTLSRLSIDEDEPVDDFGFEENEDQFPDLRLQKEGTMNSSRFKPREVMTMGLGLIIDENVEPEPRHLYSKLSVLTTSPTASPPSSPPNSPKIMHPVSLELPLPEDESTSKTKTNDKRKKRTRQKPTVTQSLKSLTPNKGLQNSSSIIEETNEDEEQEYTFHKKPSLWKLPVRKRRPTIMPLPPQPQSRLYQDHPFFKQEMDFVQHDIEITSRVVLKPVQSKPELKKYSLLRTNRNELSSLITKKRNSLIPPLVRKPTDF